MPPDSHTRPLPDATTLLLAPRPWSFTLTAISVTVGSLLADTPFRLGLFGATLVGLVFAHAATNLTNDYFDVRAGVDTPDAPTAQYRPHPLVEGTMSGRQILIEAGVCYGIAALLGVYLLSVRGWPIALLALVGGLASWAYTAAPVQYKYRGLGEISVFLMWGPLVVLGSYFVQAGGWAGVGPVLLVSVPVGLWVALVLLANNLKDIAYDRRTGATTLATLLGRSGALPLYTTGLVGIYGLSIGAIAGGVLPIESAIVLASAPKAYRELRTLQTAETIPEDADPRTAQLANSYGALLILSLLLEPWSPLHGVLE